MYQIADKIVYPSHGVGIIEDIIEKNFNGIVGQFYIIKFIDTGVKIMAPVSKAARLGIRVVSNHTRVHEALTVMEKSTTIPVNEHWNKRQKEYLLKIKTGCILDMAEVYRDLSLLSLEKALSFGEKKIYENVRKLLANEIAEARGIATPTAHELMERAVSV